MIVKTKKKYLKGDPKKDNVRTDTLERSEEQALANAIRQEEEMNPKKKDSGTTSGYRNVGRPLTTRQGAPEKLKYIEAKEISSGSSMDKTLKKSTAKISAPAKKRKLSLRRNRFENGGKVTGAKTEKSRAGMSMTLGEGEKLRKKREQEQLERSVRESNRAKRINESEARRAKARPDYRPKKKIEEGLRDDDGRILSANKLRRLDVTKLEMTSPKKEIQKSTAKISVPAKKRRLRRK